MKIPANKLSPQFFKYQKEYEEKALKVLRSGYYVLGEEVNLFEKEFADFVGTKHCVGLASGLDALWISFRLLGIGKGDEVIVQSNAYIASVMGITINGATPIFVEPDEFFGLDPLKISEKITSKTKAILVVHLYGNPCDMEKITFIAKKHKLYLIEDCAQAHGATISNKQVGTFGDIGCFSFYPSKNLGAFGEAGAITTNSEELAQKFKVFRNYGSEKRYHNMVVGTNSRLDEMQAGLLRVKLSHLKELNEERISVCKKYSEKIKNPLIKLPKFQQNFSSVFHQFVIRTNHRAKLIEFLEENEIGSLIHYPIPPHLSEAYGYLNHKKGDFPIAENFSDTVLSLPLFNGISDDEIDYICRKINEFKV